MPLYSRPRFDGAAQRLYDLYARTFEFRDVSWLRRLGKAVFVTFLGGEARLQSYAKQHFEISYTHDIGGSTSLDARKVKRVEQFDRSVERDLLDSSRPDVDAARPERSSCRTRASTRRDWRAGPTRSAADRPLDRPRSERTPHQGHPLRRGGRGTASRAEGIPLEYALVEGLPRSEARKIYERADLLVEQLLLGWYSNLAIELMALGKPVVSYIRDEDLRFVPEEMARDLPVINATPDSVYSVLRTWLTERRDQLPEVGRASRAYVERWHDPLKIAARTKADYERALGRS